MQYAIGRQTYIIHHAETWTAIRDFIILIDIAKDINGLRYVLRNSANIINTDFICVLYNANIIFHCDKLKKFYIRGNKFRL